VPFIVRAPPTRHAQMLVQVPVNTWQAYNPWGGKSLYPFNSTDLAPAQRVSFDRPLAFTAQGPFDWEYNLVRFLEREGYDVSYQTDLDTDAHPESLLEHRLVIVAGHGEYWTKEMRDAFNAARTAGTNLAFTGSNADYWQVRYENNRRTIVGYKGLRPRSRAEPGAPNRPLRELTPPRPECALMGVMFLRLREHQSGPVDYTVTNTASTDPWFRNTGFNRGQGARRRRQRVGLAARPPPPPSSCVKPQLKVLFHFEGPAGERRCSAIHGDVGRTRVCRRSAAALVVARHLQPHALRAHASTRHPATAVHAQRARRSRTARQADCRSTSPCRGAWSR
jgi:hypothetical protein